MATQMLNCQGMNCPMPIVEMSKTARTLASGDLLEVTATDLAFKLDVEAWSRRTGHEIESFVEGPIQTVRVRIK
ncbi:MAG: sulfurtransferase TusA family protein [Planctomycetaceae bacterium]